MRLSWRLSINNVERDAFPIYGDSLSIRWAKQSNEQFFRKSLSGELTFIADDFARILAGGINTKNFITALDDDSGEMVFSGSFHLTDCEVDEDGQTIKVTPIIDDNYNEIIAGLEKEYNLVKLAPEVVRLQASKRPLIQIYRPNYPKVGCILSGMYWEQDAKEVAETDLGSYSFSQVGASFISALLDIQGDIGNDIPSLFLNTSGVPTAPITKDGYTLTPGFNSSLNRYTLEISDSDSVVLWRGYRNYTAGRFGVYSMVPLVGQTGSVTIVFRSERMYCRLVCDVDSIRGNPTSQIPQEDITENNLNYTRVISYVPDNAFYITDAVSETPTEYGLTPDGTYYQRPYWPFGDIIPAIQSSWDGISIWWLGSPTDWLVEQDGRKAFMLNDAFPLWSVINVLLSENNTGLTFGDTADYSRFFYGDGGGIRGANYRLFLTPKSNIISAEYDQAAQRGNISLRQLFDMLRDCFRCYWFVDGDKLRIEHIEFFRRGGSYDITPAIGVDLVAQYYSRSGKAVATGQSKYKYNKPETYSRIEFGWMDKVTAQFNGYPINIISDYVEKERVEKKDISQFTSDIDYVLLNPSAISKDGFMLLCAVDDNGTWKIPFVDFGDNQTYVMQNGYMSFLWLVRYYFYDLPAPNYEIDGVAGVAIGTMPIKTQEVTFPVNQLPDLFKLVKTYIGSGAIDRISFGLIDMICKATLLY